MANPEFETKSLQNVMSSIDEAAKLKLSQLLERIVKGNDSVLETPLTKVTSSKDILARWDEIYNKHGDRLDEKLRELEELNREKYGPRSIAAPWHQRKGGVLEYFNKKAIEFTCEGKSNANLRPINFGTAVSAMKNSTSSGLPKLVKKGIAKLSAYKRYGKDVFAWPCVMYTRTQEGGKTRLVWGYPMADSIHEMMYFYPLLRYRQKFTPWRSALNGPDATARKLTELFHSKGADHVFVSQDFSAYDSSISSELQDRAFGMIAALFQRKFREDIISLAETFNQIGLITPDGILSGPHGVPSGSTFTNEVDSNAQYLILHDAGIKDGSFDIQGDDGAYVLPKSMVGEVNERFKEAGLTVNEDKSYISSEYFVYLQNYYSKSYEQNGILSPIYPVYRALNRLVHMERWVNFEEFGIPGSDYFALRAITILENCRWHPLFEELVTFVHGIDKYGLAFRTKSLNAYKQMVNETSGGIGSMIHQYGDNLEGLGSFETVKLLQKLSH